MAKVIDRHAGTIKGALGDQVFKYLNGESYVAQLPHKSQVEPSAKVKAQRTRFGLIAKFAKAIYALLFLRFYWKSFVPEGTTKKLSTFTKIAKASKEFVSSTDISDLAFLAPDFGFPVVPTTTTLANTGVTLVVDPLGNSGYIDPVIETNVHALCVIHLSDPVVSALTQNRFLSLMSPGQTLSLSNELTFNMPFDGSKGEVFDAYPTRKAWFILITTNAMNEPVHYSSTFIEL